MNGNYDFMTLYVRKAHWPCNLYVSFPHWTSYIGAQICIPVVDKPSLVGKAFFPLCSAFNDGPYHPHKQGFTFTYFSVFTLAIRVRSLYSFFKNAVGSTFIRPTFFTLPNSSFQQKARMDEKRVKVWFGYSIWTYHYYTKFSPAFR